MKWNGKGKPPIGCICERVIGDSVYQVTVIAFWNGEVVVQQHDAAPEYTGVQEGYLKPLGHRERERLVSLADKLTQEYEGSFKAREVFGILFDIGMLKEPEDCPSE